MFFHFVKKGDNIYELGKKYNINISKIIEDNSLIDPINLVINQCLLIDNGDYVVKKGDTLFNVAKEHNIPLNELIKINNNIDPNILQEGQKIKLKQINKNKKVFNGYCYLYSNKETIEKTLPYLTTLSIFSYKINEDGSLNKQNEDDLIGLAKSYNVKPVMVITNLKENGGFSPTLISRVINNENIIQQLINSIEEILISKGYEGINFDFEYVKEEDKDKFVAFIRKMSTHFKNKGYYISISLAPKTSINQKGLLYSAHDYNLLGKEVDHVILMTYEWGYTFGPSMPVAPLNEIKRVLDYAITEINRNKIIMGIPNYGYDFIVPYKEKQKARSIKNNQAIVIAFNNHASILRNETGKTPYFKYTKDDIKHEVQFDDPCSIEEKLSLIDNYNIIGASIWTISTYIKYIYLLINHCYEIDKNL